MQSVADRNERAGDDRCNRLEKLAEAIDVETDATLNLVSFVNRKPSDPAD